MAIFALAQCAENITLLELSQTSERLWILVHSDYGPILVGGWYRPPVQGELDSIKTLREEWNQLSEHAIGTIILGDMNTHQKKWLRKSARNSAEGEELQRFCRDLELQPGGATKKAIVPVLLEHLQNSGSAANDLLTEVKPHFPSEADAQMLSSYKGWGGGEDSFLVLLFGANFSETVSLIYVIFFTDLAQRCEPKTVKVSCKSDKPF